MLHIKDLFDKNKHVPKKKDGSLIGLEGEKISSKYYGVGYSPYIEKYIMYTVVTWIAWYNRYFEITKEEYEAFGTNEIDELADKLYKQGISSERYLFSDKKDENNEEQLKLCDKAHIYTNKK